jgi:protein-S-isoprenylcysteine O-methyltransferase Ste14
MMEWTRGPSWIVTVLIVCTAYSILYLVFRTHGREAAVPSGPAEAGQKLVLEALRRVGD